MVREKGRGDVTAELSQKVAAKLRREFAIVAQEVWVDSRHRVDFVAFSPGAGGRNCALEHGKFVFVEVKSCMDDFKSGHGLTFRGDDNWLVSPATLRTSFTTGVCCRSACRSTVPIGAASCGLHMIAGCKARIALETIRRFACFGRC